LSVGGVGCIAATANVAPRDFVTLIRKFNEGDLSGAKELHHKLFPLCKAMFIETNPVPVKTVLSLMGMIKMEVRPPLVPLTKENFEKVKEVARGYGLI
jgi:4-hydroxy-tetrahydrodipicolinate synthase